MKIDGHAVAEKIYGKLKERVKTLRKENIVPHLVVILVGEHPASIAYVTLKQKKGEEIGAKVTVLTYPTKVTTDELIEKVKLLNEDPYVHGILIQRPLPQQIDIQKLELTTDPQKDIDGFHPDSPYTLPLPLAVEKILEEVYIINSKQEARNTKQIQNTKEKNSKTFSDFGFRYSNFISWLKTKDIVVLGKGPTGGGPIITYFKKLHINTDLIDSKTKTPEKLMKSADILISAVGKESIIKPEVLKKGVILISVGINRGEDHKLHGDYDTEKIKDIASYYTATPGGVGPVNVAMLMENLLTAAEKQTMHT